MRWQYTIYVPLSAEFRHHLHELMVETSDKLRDDLNDYQRKLVWEAQSIATCVSQQSECDDRELSGRSGHFWSRG